MSNKALWNDLSHDEKIRLLKSKTIDEIIQDHRPDTIESEAFRQILESERAFWAPANLKAAKFIDEVPSKDTTIGARRDLNRAEAILELIDNSIDAWLRRKEEYPKKTPSILEIYIDKDNSTKILTFQDNAGGVATTKLVNLVIPGHSDTTPFEETIGSYRTGGKKAIFKLASEANIRTHYWDPIETTEDETVEVHLDEKWLNDPTDYKFPYYVLNDKALLQRGQTVYRLRLRDDIADWNQTIQDQIRLELRRTYTLLLLRHPDIEIHFLDRKNAVEPLPEMYKFTSVKGRNIDLQPQRVWFKCNLDIDGALQAIVIEIILGCRTTSAASVDDDIWGIDLYGNDRLFVLHDQDNVLQWFSMPRGASRQFMRGLINIHGPNTAVPWDTHKRHLNVDQPIIDILKTNKLIQALFEQWREAYIALSAAKDIKNTINLPLDPWRTAKDLNIPYQSDVDLELKRKRGMTLPETLHRPIVPNPSSHTRPIDIKFNVTPKEFRQLSSDFNLSGEPDDREARTELSEAIKDYLLNKE